MANTTLSDYIVVTDQALSPELCAALIERFEASDRLEKAELKDGFSFTQLDITAAWPDMQEALVKVFLAHVASYQKQVEAYFWPPSFGFEHLRMKRYLPDGRDCFPPHVDVMGRDAARRFLAAMIYLNAPEAGETVFGHLGMRITPVTGRMMCFPPLWMFPHEGLPPKNGPKYILNTYLCYPG
jgi:prolyl 4-hydroxylase